MASKSATVDSVGNGTGGEDPQNIQSPTQESWTGHISEFLKAQCSALINWTIAALFWDGRRASYLERITLLMSSWRDAAQNIVTDLLKWYSAPVEHGETTTGVQPILSGMTDGLEPIMSILMSQSNSSVENGLLSASLGATAPRVAYSAHQCGTRGRIPSRVMKYSAREPGLGAQASLNPTAISEDIVLLRSRILICTLINPLNGKEVPTRALVDTGADVSVVKKRVADCVVGKDHFETNDGTEIDLEGFGRKIVKPLGKITLQLRLRCGTPITDTFYIVEDEDSPDLDICLGLVASVKTRHVILKICEDCNGSTFSCKPV